ncbi:beta-microseminoprotein-like [Narcine bancroftii]|uniref:beta-microseminoprotein-like n=1 Tax=Narcine bancroftii TaxID=1343680 RepID=UPI00383124C3
MSLFGMNPKVLLCIVLLLPAVPLSDSACFFAEKDPNSDCIDNFDGSAHGVGTQWRNSHCMQCSCMESNYRCCDLAMRPINYPSECIAVLDHERCVYRVHLREDPSIECPVNTFIG